ncbi:copper amine oxidase [Gracilibacillus caseinilyticus]|uniref:Copper amine oxidase n=1 Tax=Gracilibacillus caseinilyticus TaxID=2932256 RepID=A0ABY4EZM3_9BACI|nr:copper amine oxidase [Gracilibacillus caseinilyticus]UOQ49839.1 copper amine oxidase [Gracilibacillus caseinilyticus]
MNWKKALLVVPMSAALVIPATEEYVSAASEDSMPTVSTAGADLRATLSTSLSEHANLAIITMRKGIEGAEDFEAAKAQLSENTDDLSAAIASVYGDEAGQAFKDMWSAHIGYFVDYVMGTAEEDEGKKQAALDELKQYRQEFSSFLDDATEGRVEAGALAEGLQQHVNQLIGAFDAYVAGNYDEAFNLHAEASNHMFMPAKGLSSAITSQFPDKFNNTLAVTPASDLRQTLNNILSNHVVFAVTAMQNGIEGEESAEIFEANAAQLSKNTDKLAKTIESVYGAEAGEQFKSMWSDHVSYFVDYVKATANEDEEAKQAALDELAQYREDFSTFMETATDGNISADAVAAELQEHVNQLIGSFDAYAAGNYEEAYDSFHEGYVYANDISKALSGAIVKQYPDKFESSMPSDMPKTGMGGTDKDVMNYLAYMIASVFVIMAAGGYTMYRRRSATQSK